MTAPNPQALTGTIRSIALAFPKTRRTNDYWRAHHPELVAKAEQSTLSKIFDAPAGSLSAFDRTMSAYLSDPFRGTVERRILEPGQTALDLELAAARQALELAGLGPRDVDLLLVSSLRSEGYGVGNAAFVVRELGLSAPGFNFESACSSSLVGLQLATGAIAAGQARRVLVVISCTYSRDVDEHDSFSWFLGDGCAAFVVEACPAGDEGVVAIHTVPTHQTCGAFAYHLVERDGAPALRILPGGDAGTTLRTNSESYLRACVDGVLSKAGRRIDELDFVVANTPLAWFRAFVAEVLGVAPDKTISIYDRYANIGPVLTPANLVHALHEGKIRPGSLVLLWAIGSVSTASAILVRWGQATFGPLPE